MRVIKISIISFVTAFYNVRKLQRTNLKYTISVDDSSRKKRALELQLRIKHHIDQMVSVFVWGMWDCLKY